MIVRLTDEPLDTVTGVHIQFRGMSLIRRSDGEEIYRQFTPPRRIDVLRYRNGDATLLADLAVPAGSYRAVRLEVDSQPNVRDSYATLITGEECELSMPPESRRPWDIHQLFDIGKAQQSFTIHVDLFQSVRSVDCVNGIRFVPVVQLVDDAKGGWFEGDIDPALLTYLCRPKVYVFFLEGQLPDDMGTTVPNRQPLAVADGYVDNNRSRYRTRSFESIVVPSSPAPIGECARDPTAPGCVRPGYFLLAFSCAEDDPEIDEDLEFLAYGAGTVRPGVGTVVDFESLIQPTEDPTAP